ncbi:MAG TPA: SRPBCC family protein [Blastocatellia bacterium]|nr:SRPBCC family protein [Blastocatellia bacterium]
MKEYEHTVVVEASSGKVFDFVSDVQNLPRYLPTVRNAEALEGERVRLQGESAGRQYENEGVFRVDKENRRIEWGSVDEGRYRGWLEVKDHENVEWSIVTARLTFAEQPELAEQMKGQNMDVDAAIQDSLEKALVSIQNYCESHGGKVEADSPIITRQWRETSHG